MAKKTDKRQKIYIFDTTLRDAEQCPGASMTSQEKLNVAQQLARLGVDIIEAGFPYSSPGDFEAVQTIVKKVKGPTITGLARCRPEDIDRTAEALQGSKRVRLHTFIGTSPTHREGILRKSKKEVLEMAVSSVARACRLVKEVEFSPMDATRTEFDYLCQVVEKTIEAGAAVINIPDTVGYALPWEFGDLIRRLRESVPNIDKAILSVHCHDDLGLATANSLAAVANGATQVECTINGLGERAGNAALEEIVVAIDTRPELKRKFVIGLNLKELYRTSRLVREVTGMPVQPNKAIVGANAFAHSSGIHVDGVLKQRETFEIIRPQKIGLEQSQIVLTSRSGRHAVKHRLAELGYQLSAGELEKTYQRFLAVADQRKQVTDEELESLVADELRLAQEIYQLDYLNVVSGGTTIPTATVRLRRDGDLLQAVTNGVGSVDAVYRAIAQIINVQHRLVDYNVSSVTGGTDALGEVMVRISDRAGTIHTGRGSSMDIIDASAKAYLQALNKMVLRAGVAARTKSKRRRTQSKAKQ
ncbi:MAG: 2-isopropylmalate synthase [Armatimonadetes bacterium]|nr:2-isopropylmalate synthase [Armatimonadota bacterium]NIM24278.1 2-isopropylmalate synthase [Armatimonadota bacterium]NIM68147.1 2-isopropylmalate synthase [Armatimonadota bacterium]NIM76607.1 2-isopropylmalate synthase [Armatimonadota bacterium]NIN06352.1 2-isopropylmalate synthase [Armatimonadota bacterium]